MNIERENPESEAAAHAGVKVKGCGCIQQAFTILDECRP